LQSGCDEWRVLYNQIRPHESLGMKVPMSRYQPSTRSYQEATEPFEYSAVDTIRKVRDTGQISYQGKTYKISEAFKGQKIGIRPTTQDGIMGVYYRHQRITQLNLRRK